ncbi:MAG: alpha/beta fold hydrolase [Bacteroidetes bacterium]|nr:alpha/beta fold hydrolase [Bacteroidota bacterium]
MTFDDSKFRPSLLFRSAHFNTIYPNRKRKVEGVNYTRKRLTTWDNDFVDLDFSKIGSKQLVLVLHGLEGNSDRQYARGMVKMANQRGFDAMVFNQRSCSGEMNLLPTSYHSGKSDDLKFVIEEIAKDYESIFLVGFSLGGNILLKYLGEQGSIVLKKIKKAVAISVPVDLSDSAIQLAKRQNWIYMRRFLKTLKAKTTKKMQQFEALSISIDELNSCNSFIDFDNLYTAPVHGFKDANDYWKQASSKQFLNDIALPTLLVNALDDPFLGKHCYPYQEAKLNKQLELITPKHGGHVGFGESFNIENPLWTEGLVMQFFTS